MTGATMIRLRSRVFTAILLIVSAGATAAHAQSKVRPRTTP